MRLDGAPSWRLSLDNPQGLHIALFVRDAVGLVTPPSHGVPPMLAAEIPDHTAALADTGRAEAGGQWLAWWHRLVTHEIAPHYSPAVDEDAWRRRAAEYQRVVDPPDFESLAGLPALRTAVVATFGAAREWSNALKRRVAGSPPFEHSLVRDVAQEIITERGVSPDELDAAVMVLDVAGAWSYLAGPGAMCCSATTLGDPATARALFREAFVSALDA